MVDLPHPLSALAEERILFIRGPDWPEATQLPRERADLIAATAMVAVRCQRVLADALYPQIVDSLGTQDTDPVRTGPCPTVTASRAERHDSIRGDVGDKAPIAAPVSDAVGFEISHGGMTRSSLTSGGRSLPLVSVPARESRPGWAL